jgi:hypothetical protein
MNSITVEIDYGSHNGGVTAYFFDSEQPAKTILAQAVSEGVLMVPAGATSAANGGRKVQRETFYPIQRVVSVG